MRDHIEDVDAQSSAITLDVAAGRRPRIHVAQTGIATAMEQQTATTSEIAQSVQHGATASSQMSHDIEELAAETGRVSASVHELERAAADMSHLAEDLRGQAA